MGFAHKSRAFHKTLVGVSLASLVLSGCGIGGNGGRPSGQLPPAPFNPLQEGPSDEYVIGPMDQLKIFVWRNNELSAEVQVRPDGRITTPLVTDMPAVGKTSTMLAQDIKLQLSEFIRDPLVSVIVQNPIGGQQVRIVGATEKPASLPFRANMTLLDALIAVGGLSEYAAGNKARLVRFDRVSGRQREYALKVGDLLRRGDTRANVRLAPGDVIIIPESSF